MRNNTLLLSKYSGRSIEDLKSSYYAIQKRIDSMHVDAAILTGIIPLPEGKAFWSSNEINWNDSRLDNTRETYFKLLRKSSDLRYVINYREAEESNTLEQFLLYEEIDEFISRNFNSFKELVEFYQRNNLIRGLSSLREKCLENPDYLTEVMV